MQLTKDELSEIVDELESYRGRQTELITVYISADYEAVSVQKQLEAEKSTAKNIKSTSTRKNVTDALDKIVRHLKEFKKTPENGLAVFCGNISKIEGQDDLRLWSIEPPMPLNVRLYRCDKEFVIEPLREQLAVSEIYGLLVMDRKEATIGVLEGKRIEIIQKMTSGVPSKVRAGGQSSQRFHRITEGLTREFYRRIADAMKETFFDNPKLKGIIIGGPIPTKDEFVDGGYLPTQLQAKVLGKIDIGGSDESGIKELVTKSQTLLAKQEITRETKILEKFFETLGQNPNKAAYKEPEIRKAIQYGAVETLFLSKGLNKQLSSELKKLAQGIDSNVEIISTETEEGKQFFNLSGMGAILRFAIN